MKLHLKRSQSGKLLGGVKFELEAKAQLTQEESELINRYKVQDELLAEKQIKIPLTNKVLVVKLTIGSLISGQKFKCNEISEILGYEEEIKTSCQSLCQLLEVMRSFGGEEVIEFTAEGSKTLAPLQ